MRKNLLLPAALLASFALAGTVLAQTPDTPPPHGDHAFGPGHEHHHGGPLMHLLKQLDLTDAQKASVHQIMQSEHESDRAKHRALHAQRRAFLTAVPGTGAYQNAANALADAEANAARGRVQNMAALHSKLYALLTPAQQAKLADLLANLPERPAPPAG